MTDKELAEEKSSRDRAGSRWTSASNSGIAQALDAAIYYGFGVEYLDEFPLASSSPITREEADAAFRGRVRPERFTIVAAGSFGEDVPTPASGVGLEP